MEKILNIYELEYDTKNPVVCVDEKPIVLHENGSPSIECAPGKTKKVDYEYKRKGTANVFCAVEPKAGVYIKRVTERKTGDDFAKFIYSLYRKYKDCDSITLVLDNYTTHSVKSLIKFYGEYKGNKIWNKFNITYTPKHANWLNQAEIAIGMYSRQCLGQSRIPTIDQLRKKTNAWCKSVNRRNITIKWKFKTQDAKEKFDY